MLDRIRQGMRQQLRYPKHFRIAAPKWPDLSESLEGLVGLLRPNTSALMTKSKQEEELLDMAVDVGTLVWRIQQRLNAASELPAELRRVSRDLESTWDALTQKGIEIKDHTGQDYDSGMALRVVAAQPVAGLTRQQIVETLKPTIYHRDRIIQRGDVILGVPADSEQSDEVAERA